MANVAEDSLEAILSDDSEILSIPSDYDSDSSRIRHFELNENNESFDRIFDDNEVETVESASAVSTGSVKKKAPGVNKRAIKRFQGRKMKSSVDDHNDLDAELFRIFSDDELRLKKQPWADLFQKRGPFSTAQRMRLKTLRRRVLSRGYAQMNRLKTQKRSKEIERSHDFLAHENDKLKAENESLKRELASLKAQMLCSSA